MEEVDNINEPSPVGDSMEEAVHALPFRGNRTECYPTTLVQASGRELETCPSWKNKEDLRCLVGTKREFWLLVSHQVIRTEIMPPLTDTMSFINYIPPQETSGIQLQQTIHKAFTPTDNTPIC